MEELLKLLHEHNGELLFKLFIQVLAISYCITWIWQRIVGSQAERLVKGVLVLAGIWGISSLFGFTLITNLLHLLVPVAFLALVVIFQPELRRGLGHLGRMRTLKFDWSLADADQERTKRNIDQVIQAVRELSRSKEGALIVIEPLEGERDYVSPGTTLNADISATLLLTIFFTKSPLHDGAVIIREDKIVAAGVILPMTDDPQLSYRYGTRHRAAIGLSETYDGLCIVVSEETGAISAASRGMLARYKTAEDLYEPIMYLYTQGGDSKSHVPLSSFLSLFSKGRNTEEVPQDAQAQATSSGQYPALTQSQSTSSGQYPALSQSQSQSQIGTISTTQAQTVSEKLPPPEKTKSSESTAHDGTSAKLVTE